jgi:uncharacterized RDD family membrane protein YckC
MKTHDIMLGIVVTGARAGFRAGRLVLLPVRVATRAPLVGTAVRRAGEGLASEGAAARARVRRQLETAGSEALADADLEDAVAAALEHERTQRYARRVLASPGLERLASEAAESRLTAQVTDRVLHSPEVQRMIEEVAASPAVRAALTRQTTSLGEEIAAGVRDRTERFDATAEHRVRGWLRKPLRSQAASSVYGGLGTRAAAFAIDLVLAHLIALTGAALAGLAASMVGELRPAWLVGVLVASWWALVVGTYFSLFWTVAGQTPGMRLLRLRVAGPDGDPPRLGRSLLRLVGLGLAIVPLFAGFLPVLIDERRRGLHDFLAGTVVLHTDRDPPMVTRVNADGGL